MGIGNALAGAAITASNVDDSSGKMFTAAAARRLQEMLLENIPHYFHKEILSECLVSACSIRFSYFCSHIFVAVGAVVVLKISLF